MTINKNEKIWEKVKERDFEFEFKNETFELIEKNLEKVEFIKDHVGLRDVLFLAETSTQGFFTSTFFAAFNVDADPSYSIEENEEAFAEAYIDDPEIVFNELKNFFKEGKRKLFVGIGFEETTSPELRNQKFKSKTPTGEIQEITGLDLEIIRLLSTGEAETYQEASKMLRKFPEWYEVDTKMPEEVEQITVKKDEIDLAEKKKQILQMIDESLDKGDKEGFLVFTGMYKEMLKK